MNIAREDVDDARELRDAQLATHVVDEVGEGGASKRTQRLVRGARGSTAAANEHLFVEQHVDLVKEARSEVGGEDVPRGHEYVLADSQRVGLAREQQLDHALGDRLLEWPHEVRKCA